MTLSLAAAPVITAWDTDVPFTMDTLQADDPFGPGKGFYVWFIPSVTGRYMFHTQNGTLFSATRGWKHALVPNPTTFAQTADVTTQLTTSSGVNIVVHAPLTAGEKYLIFFRISTAATSPASPIVHIGLLTEQAWITPAERAGTSILLTLRSTVNVDDAESNGPTASWDSIMEGGVHPTDADGSGISSIANVEVFRFTDGSFVAQTYVFHNKTANMSINALGPTADFSLNQYWVEFESPTKVADRAVLTLNNAVNNNSFVTPSSTPISVRRLTAADYDPAPAQPWPQHFRGGSALSGLTQVGTYNYVAGTSVTVSPSFDLGPPDANGRFYAVLNDDIQITHEVPAMGSDRRLTISQAHIQGFGTGPRYRIWIEEHQAIGNLKLKLEDGTWVPVFNEPRFKMRAHSWQGEWWRSGDAADGVPLKIRLADGSWAIAAYLVPPPTLPADDAMPADDLYPAG